MGKMDLIDEIRVSCCSNDEDEEKRKGRRETRGDNNKPTEQVM